MIHEQSKRLGNMVEQVLRFAGLSSQHGELQRGPVEVGPLMEEAVADCLTELAGSQVTLTMDGAVPAIDGDRGALLHCLRNLLSNAGKHAGGSGVRIAARAAGAGVEIVVQDGGPGISAEDLPHIFEPFYRGLRAKEDQVQGSGLGLSLVKKIVEGHGGTVEASSSGGARFRLLLPAVKA
jgi:two-component system phosphate regulon sensor histidine kinase PhoR